MVTAPFPPRPAMIPRFAALPILRPLLDPVSGVVGADGTMGLGLPLRQGVRLKLRMNFRDWSRAVDADGLAACRAWLKACEAVLNAPSPHPDPS